jgi:hypothetical protein
MPNQSLLFERTPTPHEEVARHRAYASALRPSERFVDPITWSYFMALARLKDHHRDRRSKCQLEDLIYVANATADRTVCISGCRHIESDSLVEEALGRLKHSIVKVIQGGATGIDTSAERVAKRMGLACDTERAQWDRSIPAQHPDNKKQGPIRNAKMLKMSNVLIAFWDGESTGTGGTIKMAIEGGWVDVWERIPKPLKWRVWLVSPALLLDLETCTNAQRMRQPLT